MKKNNYISKTAFDKIKINDVYFIRFMLGTAVVLCLPYSKEAIIDGNTETQEYIDVRMIGGPWDGKKLSVIRQQLKKSS